MTTKLTTEIAWDLIRSHTIEIGRVGDPRPVVSVCMLTYNHSGFIRQAFDSVLTQEVDFPVEIVVGEDSSTDGTREIVLEYQQRHPERFRALLSTKNLGTFTGNGRLNFLRSLDACKGEYIAILEGDDFWTDRHKLKKQVSFLEANREFAGSCHLTRVEDATGEIARIFGEGLSTRVGLEDVISELSPFHSSSFIFRRDRLRQPMPDWFNGIVSADMALFVFIASAGPIHCIHEVMSTYRRHPGGITNTRAVRNGFHGQRIQLWSWLREYLGAEHFVEVDKVIQSHRRALADDSLWARIRRSLLRLGTNW